MTADTVLERLRPVAKSYFDAYDLSPAHDWFHVERVEALSRRLAADRSDVDERVLAIAVLLHDIGRGREDAGAIGDHATWGAREARRILGGGASTRTVDGDFDLDADTIDDVTHCIRAHRYSTGVEPASPAARILSDADNLDALGAIGLARVFSYGGETGATIYDPALPVDGDDSSAGRTSVNHVHKKILDLPDRMYTEAGRRLAAERATVVSAFVTRLEDEVAGER